MTLGPASLSLRGLRTVSVAARYRSFRAAADALFSVEKSHART
ncbi:MAG: hypothetical protein QNJ73_13665 [Gammaproteobacteria bacterium]|nr:hypothetical protein [Gammaproteobacteria bacterium]